MNHTELLSFRSDTFHIRLLRWEELPDIGMYSDQVITVIENQLAFLQQGDDDRFITAAMINNYVKQRIIERPHKKKYHKNQIAKLLVITLLKQVLPLHDIEKGMELQTSLRGIEVAYNQFCDEVEDAFKRLYGPLGQRDPYEITIQQVEPDTLALKMVTLSLASKLLTQKIIRMNGAQNLTQATELLIKGENSVEK